ncbi:MAG: dihydrofolate reductase family protein [Acidimicrobiia bacterium]|nr:dihydrofolate reductase family protein [Acidimicrobiia bacterium]
MKRLILQQFTTIDGLVAGPDDATNFITEYSTKHDAGFEQGAMEFLGSVDTMLLGRKTYEMFAQCWPEAQGEDVEFAHRLNSLDKFVVSSTLTEAPWGQWEPAKVIDGNIAEEVRALKRAPGKDIVIWGSIILASSLLNDGLIDEIQLRVVPTALGSGRQLFEGGVGTDLNLIGAQPHDGGLVLLRYQPART